MPPAPKIDTSVVITTCSRAGLLRGMLDSLLPQIASAPFATELVIVDDGSTDSTPEMLREICQTTPLPITVLRGEKRGVAAARNLGLTHARGAWIATCDDDQVADDAWLKTLRAAADACGATVIGGSMSLRIPKGHSLHHFGRRAQRLLGAGSRNGALRRHSSNSLPATSNVLMRADAIRRLGGFDPTFTQGGEDSDLFDRARRSGYPVWYEPRAHMEHILPASRLTLDGLHWTAQRIGSGDVRLARGRSLLAVCRLVLIRLLALTGRDLPVLCFARIAGKQRLTLEARCSLWYTQGVLASVFARNSSASAFQRRMNFRSRNGERSA